MYGIDMKFTKEAFRAALAAELRAEKGIHKKTVTNNDLAAAIGGTERTVRRYLNGERAIDAEDLVALANAFGLTAGDLMGRAIERVERS